MSNIDVNDAIDKLVSAVGDVPLALERYKRDNNVTEKITEYDFLNQVTANTEYSNTLLTRYRMMLTIKMFEMINTVSTSLLSKIDELRPNDLAKLHASLTQSFSQITAPVTKLTFDFDAETRKVAEELGISVEEVMAETKSYMEKK